MKLYKGTIFFVSKQTKKDQTLLMTPAMASPMAVTSGNTPPARREKLRKKLFFDPRKFFLTPYFPRGKCGKLRNFSFSQEFSHFPWENRNPGTHSKVSRTSCKYFHHSSQKRIPITMSSPCLCVRVSEYLKRGVLSWHVE